MSDENDGLPPDERRRYFRIEDVVKLSYRSIPREELPELIDLLNTGAGSSFTVLSSFTAMSQQMLVPLRRIEGSMPDVAACIKMLDQKLNILGRAFLLQEDDVLSQTTTAVTISAGGISFSGSKAYKEGVVLEIKLLLLPEMTGLMIYGEVVDCIKNEEANSADESYHLRTSFANIREADRDILIRHILKRQGEWLRKRRKKSEGVESEAE